MSRKARERISRREKKVERRDKMLIHNYSSDRATTEEVFDKSTQMLLYKLLTANIVHELNGVVSAGKEARVYWGIDKAKNDLAVKIYLTSSAEFRKGMLKYIEGDERFKGVKRDTKSLFYTWAQKEFRNLEQSNRAKVRVPKPIAVEGNILVMEFIGKEGVSAPSLKEYPPEDPEKAYKQVLTYLVRLYKKAKLVHGDLSEYNILIWKGKIVIIDMSQSVPTTHPLTQFLLKRDITNINKFFRRLNIKILSDEEVYKKVTE